MTRKYLNKNIIVFMEWGRWNANYSDGKQYFGLHCASCSTKKEAYKVAVEMVNYLNEKEGSTK
jgi:hypothetical protein